MSVNSGHHDIQAPCVLSGYLFVNIEELSEVMVIGRSFFKNSSFYLKFKFNHLEINMRGETIF